MAMGRILSELQFDRAAREQTRGLRFAQPHRVLGEYRAQGFGWPALANTMGNLAQLIRKCIDRVAARQFGPLYVALGIEQHRRTQIPPFPADDREVERECRLLQMNLEAVRERPTLLVDRAACGDYRNLRIGKAELRVPKLRQTVSRAAARGYFSRHAKDQTDEMSVVDMQV